MEEPMIKTSHDDLVDASRGWGIIANKTVLSGLMFAGTGIFSLYISRNYPIGTALDMGTGYVPRLLCWILVGLGAIILLQGYREYQATQGSGVGVFAAWRGLFFVTVSMVAFALTLETLGLVIAIMLLVGIGAIATRDLRLMETVIAGVALAVMSWAIFVLGLGLTIPVWPW
jgi:putative tricarboxylic transport membrane protein